MIDQIRPDLYRIGIPLPQSPLKEINAYLIKGKDRDLLVDTGMNREECLQAMRIGLKELDVDLGRTDFFITHLHADHLGLVEHLVTDEGRVYLSEMEVSVLRDIRKYLKERVEELFAFYISNGFPEEELREASKNHPGFRFRPKMDVPFYGLKEGDRLAAGPYVFECIETPGHSPGHMCLFEPKEKILFSGDHILFDITPNITRWPEYENPLKDYFESLDRVDRLDVDLVLPGHRSFEGDLHSRISALRTHYRHRLEEILVSLARGDKTAWDVAGEITWDIAVDSWKDFPTVQKWFAVGETIAHLNYLVSEGGVQLEEVDGMRVYSVTG